jgi:hypothetical protein
VTCDSKVQTFIVVIQFDQCLVKPVFCQQEQDYSSVVFAYELAAINSDSSRQIVIACLQTYCFTQFTVLQKQVWYDVTCNGLGMVDLLQADMLHSNIGMYRHLMGSELCFHMLIILTTELCYNWIAYNRKVFNTCNYGLCYSRECPVTAENSVHL